jgi:hypothetical protein
MKKTVDTIFMDQDKSIHFVWFFPLEKNRILELHGPLEVLWSHIPYFFKLGCTLIVTSILPNNFNANHLELESDSTG